MTVEKTVSYYLSLMDQFVCHCMSFAGCHDASGWLLRCVWPGARGDGRLG